MKWETGASDVPVIFWCTLGAFSLIGRDSALQSVCGIEDTEVEIMARTRNGGNNRGRRSGNSGLSTGRLRALALAPTATRSGIVNGNTRNVGAFTLNRETAGNRAGFSGFNAAGFGLKSNTSNVAARGRRGGAGGTQASGRGRSSGNNTTAFNAAGAATRTGRSSGG